MKKNKKRMPRYDYRCADCEQDFVAIHGINEELEQCDLCGKSGNIKRIPSLPFTFHKNSLQKPGELVKMFIEETKQSVQEDKQVYRKEYDPNDNNS